MEVYNMGHCFSHLTKTDRYKLEAALLAGEKPQTIADRLHVHVSTIYREKNRAHGLPAEMSRVNAKKFEIFFS